MRGWAHSSGVVFAALLLATCASPYDPPQVYDEVSRDGRTFEMTIKSGDRNRFLKGPRLH